MIITTTPSRGSSFTLEQAELKNSALSDLFTKYKIGEKDGDAFIPAIFKPCPVICLAKGKGLKCRGLVPHRLNENVTHITALVIDLDHMPFKAYAEVGSKLLHLAVEAYVWQTYSHQNNGHDDNCARVVIPFAQPLAIKSKADWSSRLWPMLVKHFGFDLFADHCSDPARLYYLPRKPFGASVQRDSAHLRGPLFDPEPLCVAVPELPAQAEKEGNPPPVAAPEEDPSRPVDLQGFRAKLALCQKHKTIAQAVLAGRALTPAPGRRAAGEPSRYRAWLNITAVLSMMAEGWESSSALLELLRPSYQAEVQESPEDCTPWEKIEGLLASARANAPFRKAEQQAEQEAQAKAVTHALGALLGPKEPKAEPPRLEAGKDSPRLEAGKEGDPPPAPPREEWEQALQRKIDSEGNEKLLPSAVNVALILANAPEWKGALRRNDLTATLEVFDSPLASGKQALRSTDAARVADWISCSRFRITPPDSVVWSRMEVVCEMNAYDPLKNFLSDLKWDGVSRVDKLFTTYFGASTEVDGEDLTGHLATLSRRFLIQLMARGLSPGCQADTVVVLEGDQGSGKSSALRILGGEFYIDATPDPHDKDAQSLCSEVWIIELGELDALKRSEVTAWKQFITKTADTFRPPYGRVAIRAERRCVFVGTTNETNYLQDVTGNRRWWPVQCGTIDLLALKKDREQLFAEAVALFKQGEVWHLTKEESAVAEQQAEGRQSEDSVADAIVNYITSKPEANRPHYLTTHEVCVDILNENASRGLEVKIGKAFRRLKFKKRRVKEAGTLKWINIVPDAMYKSKEKVRKSISQQMAELKGMEIVR